jgi:cytochrome b561
MATAPAGYSRLQIALHWIVVLIVAAQYVFHDYMAEAYRAWTRTQTVEVGAGALSHMLGGTLVLVFILWRLYLRMTRGAPAAPVGEPAMLSLVARLTHLALYILLVLVPLSGIAAWGFDVKSAAGVHELLKNILFFVILLHFAGAVFGQVVLKNRVIGRMMKAEG